MCAICRSGRVNPKAKITIVQRSPATALIDGDNGMGHLVMTFAANLAVELARESASAGSARGARTMRARPASMPTIPLAHGMVGIYAAVSSANHMAPWGGAEPLMGTNPIAVAHSGRQGGAGGARHRDVGRFVRHHPHICDRRKADAGRLGGAIARRASRSPIAKRVAEGVLLPIGGYKGSGLALMIGLLAGVLNGAAFGREVIDFTAPGTERMQHRAVHDRARRRAVPAAGSVRRRNGSASARIAVVRATARLRCRSGIRARSAGAARKTAAKTASQLTAQLVKQLDELAAGLKVKPLSARSS